MFFRVLAIALVVSVWGCRAGRDGARPRSQSPIQPVAPTSGTGDFEPRPPPLVLPTLARERATQRLMHDALSLVETLVAAREPTGTLLGHSTVGATLHPEEAPLRAQIRPEAPLQLIAGSVSLTGRVWTDATLSLKLHVDNLGDIPLTIERLVGPEAARTDVDGVNAPAELLQPVTELLERWCQGSAPVPPSAERLQRGVASERIALRLSPSLSLSDVPSAADFPRPTCPPALTGARILSVNVVFADRRGHVFRAAVGRNGERLYANLSAWDGAGPGAHAIRFAHSTVRVPEALRTFLPDLARFTSATLGGRQPNPVLFTMHPHVRHDPVHFMRHTHESLGDMTLTGLAMRLIGEQDENHNIVLAVYIDRHGTHLLDLRTDVSGFRSERVAAHHDVLPFAAALVREASTPSTRQALLPTAPDNPDLNRVRRYFQQLHLHPAAPLNEVALESAGEALRRPIRTWIANQFVLVATEVSGETIDMELTPNTGLSPVLAVTRVRRVETPPPAPLSGPEFGCTGGVFVGNDRSWAVVYYECSDGQTRALRCRGEACTCESGPSTGDQVTDDAARRVVRTFVGPLPSPEGTADAVAFARHHCGWRMRP